MEIAQAKNYLGQLRAYSFVDMTLLCMTLSTSTIRVAGTLLLWLGFLVYLEGMHRDSGRLLWPRWVAPLLFATGAALTGSWLVAPFIIMCHIYALKKELVVVGILGPLLNGLLKVVMVLPLAMENERGWFILSLVMVAMTLRNFAGDLRDVQKDRQANTITPAVWLGMRRDVRWVYPSALAATSTLWWTLGDESVWLLGAVYAIQAVTYRLTPR